jgi:hypothetical protein
LVRSRGFREAAGVTTITVITLTTAATVTYATAATAAAQEMGVQGIFRRNVDQQYILVPFVPVESTGRKGRTCFRLEPSLALQVDLPII